MKFTIVSAFVAADWLTDVQLQLWIKKLTVGHFIFLTDESTTGNTILLRQIRCCKLFSASVRTPGMRSHAENCGRRNQLMSEFASRIVVFGKVPFLPEWRAEQQVELIDEVVPTYE